MARDGVQVAKSLQKVSVAVVRDGANGADESGDTLTKTGIGMSTVGLPEAGVPIASVGAALEGAGVKLNATADVVEGEYQTAVMGVVGAAIDKKVDNMIGNVVKSQDLNQQRKGILDANKDVLKEVAGQAIDEIKKENK